MKASRPVRVRGIIMALAAMAVVLATAVPAALADPPAGGRVTVTNPAGIHVWFEQPHPQGVYASYDDVVISVQATRGCYATVFVVDTYGFVHVVHPFSPDDNAWVHGGRTYRFSGRELGLDGFGGRGIAHVFAIGSPYPFDYSPYGESIFVGRYGYRIQGDPYVGCRQLYVSLLPATCQWDQVGVGFARFYVREWARYPVYLCHGSHGRGSHVRTGRCDWCDSAYDTYRVHVNDPRVVLRSAPRYKDTYKDSYANTTIERAAGARQYRMVRDNKNAQRAKRADRVSVTTTTGRSKSYARIVSSGRTVDRTVAPAGRRTKVSKRAGAAKQSASNTSYSVKKTNYKKGRVSR